MDIKEITTSLRDALHDQGHQNVELEFRLGRYINGSFVAGVSKLFFETLSRILDASTSFERVNITTLEKLNGTDARFVITNGDEANGKWCYKKKVCTSTDRDPENKGFTKRASVSIEGHDHAPPPPGSPPFKYHRLKKRSSYMHDCWSVDLTQVTSNLPGQFDNDEEIYEVEVELSRTDAYFMYTLDHLVAWGIHLLNEIQHHVESKIKSKM